MMGVYWFMISLVDWLKNLSEDYSVQHFDDVESGIFVDKIKEDIYLIKNAEVKK